jgi:hypothetical protein
VVLWSNRRTIPSKKETSHAENDSLGYHVFVLQRIHCQDFQSAYPETGARQKDAGCLLDGRNLHRGFRAAMANNEELGLASGKRE